MSAFRWLAMALVAASVGLAGCSEDASESESVDAGAPTTAEGPKTDAGLTAQELVIEPPVAAPAAAANAAPLGEVEEIEWDSLIPDDWRPDLLMGDEEIADLSDDDPRAKELMEKLEALWKEAPVVEALDGRAVRLPGFVVPLETDGKAVSSFLLVPYYGACIHVPPPPANQTVYVVTETGNPFRGELFDTVWVTGTLRVEPTSSELAEAGYSIKGARVAPYDEAVSAE